MIGHRHARDLPIAEVTTILHDPRLDFRRKVIAGQPVPPDLIDAYNDQVGTPQMVKAPADDVEITARPGARRRRSSS